MRKQKTCSECYGAGSVEDTAMGVVMGVALGMGYFPSRKPCPECYGAGTVEDKS